MRAARNAIPPHNRNRSSAEQMAKVQEITERPQEAAVKTAGWRSVGAATWYSSFLCHASTMESAHRTPAQSARKSSRFPYRTSEASRRQQLSLCLQVPTPRPFRAAARCAPTLASSCRRSSIFALRSADTYQLSTLSEIANDWRIVVQIYNVYSPPGEIRRLADCRKPGVCRSEAECITPAALALRLFPFLRQDL